jgi:hypothetical protein
MKKRLIIFIIALYTFALQAQNPIYDAKTTGPYLMIYKLNEQQAKFAIDHPQYLDSQILYTNLYQKVPYDSIYNSRKPYSAWTNSNPLDPSTAHALGVNTNGYFLTVLINDLNRINVVLKEYPFFSSQLLQINKAYILYVADSAGFEVQNATVTLDGETCAYDPGLGGYNVRNKVLNGIFKITQGDQFTYRRIYSQTKIAKNSSPPADDYNYDLSYNGYIVTNKPVYKVGDTIFWKAFLVKPNGKGLRGKVKFKLNGGSSNSDNGQKYIDINQYVKHTDKGAYNGYYVVADSFSLDQTYTISAIRGSTYIKSLQIRVEDYTLDDIVINTSVDKREYMPGEDVKITIDAKDKNELPLMDATVDCKVTLSTVEYFEKDSVQISAYKMQNYMRMRLQMDASGQTIIILPHDSLQLAKAYYYVELNITTADNKTIKRRVDFWTTTNRDRSVANIINDTLRIDHFYNLNPVNRSFKLELRGPNNVVLMDTVISSPAIVPLGVNVANVLVKRNNDVIINQNINRLVPEINGRRTHDSIYINYKADKNTKLYYRIYRDNDIVKEGNGVSLDFKAYDKSKNSYHFQYVTLQNNGAVPRVFSQSFHLAEKQLDINVKQAKEIFPGQNVEIEIELKNAKGKPEKNVNLTAYAVNAQLPGIVDPDVPYLGLVKEQKEIYTRRINTDYCGVQRGVQLKDWMINEYELRLNPYYAMLFPAKGYKITSDTVADSTTQFQIIVTRGTVGQQVVYAYHNKKMVYSDQMGTTRRSVKTDEKALELWVHTVNYTIKIPMLTLKPFHKNIISIQIDSLTDGRVTKRESEDPFYNEIIQSEIANHSAMFRLNGYYGDTLMIYRNGKLADAFPLQLIQQKCRQISYPNPDIISAGGRRRSASPDVYYLYGPVDSAERIEFKYHRSFGHEFVFIPGIAQTMTPNNRAEHPRNLIEKLLLSQNCDNNLSDLQATWFNPFYKDTAKNHRHPQIPVRYNPGYNLNKYQYSNYYPTNTARKELAYENFYLYLDFNSVKKMWLFDLDDSSFSYLMNNNSYVIKLPEIDKFRYQVSTTNLKINKTHRYKIFIQSAVHDSAWAIKYVKIDTNHLMYYVFKPTEYRDLTSNEYFAIDRMAKILGRVPFTPWKDTVNFGEISINRVGNKQNETRMEGLVIGPNIQYPVEQAFIVLEQNGYFKYGAWTNRDGRFMINQMQPGTYMLKIKAPNYHYWLNYNVVISAQKNHLALIKLKPYATMRYDNLQYKIENDNYFMDGDGVMNDVDMSYSASPSYAPMSNSKISASESRKEASGTFIDGMRAISSIPVLISESTMDENAVFQGMQDLKLPLSPGRFQLMLDTISSNPNANRTRSNFRDYAYWIPNLKTDKLGKVKFAVSYPDNVTSWINFFPAMDNCRHSGLGKYVVKAFKPVTTRLYFPEFITEGDILKSKTQVANYTGQEQNGSFYSIINGAESTEPIVLKDFLTKYINLGPAIYGQKIELETGYKMASGYKDAENRSIETLPATVVYGKSQFVDLINDTNFTIKPIDGDIVHNVTFYSNKLNTALELFNGFELYYYADNQTLINKLEALLIKERLNDALGLKNDYKSQINELITTIAGTQSLLGWFGLFNKSQFTDIFLTARIAEVFYQASQQGHSNNTYYNACTYMVNNLTKESNEERMAMLYGLYKCQRNLDWKKYLATINEATLTTSGKLRYHYLEQATQNKTNIPAVLAMLKPTVSGQLQVPGSYYQNWCRPYFTATNNSFLAWEVLYTAKVNDKIRRALVEAMLEQPYGNAYSKALAVQAFVSEYSSSKGTNFIPKLTINAKEIKASEFPMTLSIKPNNPVQISKTGPQVYMVSNRNYRTYNPISDPNEFGISTHINKLDTGVYNLKITEKFEYTVNIFVKTNQNYVVIDIPIPAGCTHSSKPMGDFYNEIRREYRKDRVIIYLQYMNFGNHQFSIPLQTMFQGTFNTAPARVSQLDNSDKAAYTASKKFIIE